MIVGSGGRVACGWLGTVCTLGVMRMERVGNFDAADEIARQRGRAVGGALIASRRTLLVRALCSRVVMRADLRTLVSSNLRILYALHIRHHLDRRTSNMMRRRSTSVARNSLDNGKGQADGAESKLRLARHLVVRSPHRAVVHVVVEKDDVNATGGLRIASHAAAGYSLQCLGARAKKEESVHGVQRELACPVPQLRIKIARTRLLLQGSEGVIKAQVPKTESLHSQRRTEPFSTDGKYMPGKRALAGARETAQADDRA